MFVAKYPNWVATISYPDGSHRFFDGPKDLFRYLMGEGGSTTLDAEIWVTDYYTTKPMSARDAIYVAGSDVFGPMGAELIPLATADLAESFLVDHGGADVLAFDAVDEAVLKSLE
jgi:nitrous oxide reductase accessory protein NosL